MGHGSTVETENFKTHTIGNFGVPVCTFPSVSALMTIPSAVSDLLIFLASSSVWPEAPVFPT